MNDERYKLHRRFDRMGRLVGDGGMRRLFDAHVAVVGLGGVGSWAAEALARSGVGRLTLIDFDLICVTNANRQLQALQTHVGQPKATVLAQRLRGVNPQAEIKAVPLFYEARLADRMLTADLDYVVDAIDNVTAKCHLLAECRSRGLPVVCSTGASARLDPTKVEVTDLARTRIDPLAAVVRKILKQKYDFPRKGEWGIPAVFSVEHMRDPAPLDYDVERGFQCVCPTGDNEHHSCDDRNVIWGTAGFVTGTFGLAAASVVVRALV